MRSSISNSSRAARSASTSSPNAGEIQACKFWLNLERDFVKPKIIVALGATAAQSLLGKAATISKLRGAPIELEDGTVLFVTNHPSYLLRIPDREMAAGGARKIRGGPGAGARSPQETGGLNLMRKPTPCA